MERESGNEVEVDGDIQTENMILQQNNLWSFDSESEMRFKIVKRKGCQVCQGEQKVDCKKWKLN